MSDIVLVPDHTDLGFLGYVKYRMQYFQIHAMVHYYNITEIDEKCFNIVVDGVGPLNGFDILMFYPNTQSYPVDDKHKTIGIALDPSEDEIKRMILWYNIQKL